MRRHNIALRRVLNILVVFDSPIHVEWLLREPQDQLLDNFSVIFTVFIIDHRDFLHFYFEVICITVAGTVQRRLLRNGLYFPGIGAPLLLNLSRSPRQNKIQEQDVDERQRKVEIEDDLHGDLVL